jgi:YVTN family beta-propeller protein
MRRIRMEHAIMVSSLVPAVLAHGQSFVHWETAQVSPVDLTPGGGLLLVVNTPDNRLELFDVTNQGISATGSVPVGLDPVSVRARSDDEAWVVNQISDTISVIDLVARRVAATIATGDEPADVVFAGAPQRAFVTLAQPARIAVYDPSNLLIAPQVLGPQGADLRALATDGARVFAAMFLAGNRTTILSEARVSSPVNPYPGDPNPPPNSGPLFDPPIAAGLPSPPDVGLIVRQEEDGTWRDDNGANWTDAVTWGLHHHDVAIVNASTLAVSYASVSLSANMHLAVTPSGHATIVGLEASNHVRFEPNIKGVFARVVAVTIDPAGNAGASVDLNPHLTYQQPSVPQPIRDLSLGDPRGIVWNASGDRAYVTGMGSNNLVVLDAALARIGLIDVGAGPTGVRVDEAHHRVYVLNRFGASVSVIDEATLSEIDRVPFHDPTPEVITVGRPHLYDTHATSGLGHVSCATCHIDARRDGLAWDLGDPSGAMKEFNQVCENNGPCQDWHPMKGPMATQTLAGIGGSEPFHWRGDREDLSAFDVAFESINGDDEVPGAGAMGEFADFLASIRTPPNPNRLAGGGLPASMPNGGNPLTGATLFESLPVAPPSTCLTCHGGAAGRVDFVVPAVAIPEVPGSTQDINVPHLLDMHEKTGLNFASQNNSRGFGFGHDGSIDTMLNMLFQPAFTGFAPGLAGVQQRRDIEAFMLCFATDTHAGVGKQITLGGAGGPTAGPLTVEQMVSLSATGAVGLVAKGSFASERRGWYLSGPGVFQSDRVEESIAVEALLAAASPQEELTFTVVPAGSEVRIGVDRDSDGFFDRDELDACADPADARSTPQSAGCCPGDSNRDGSVGVEDLIAVILSWAQPGGPADVNGDGTVNVADLVIVVTAWGPCP